MMLSDKESRSANAPPPEVEIEPVGPEDASAIMAKALDQYTAEGWQVLSKSAYDARLIRGTRNMDLHIDLLGQVEARESGFTPLQDSGRMMAWMLLLVSLLLALTIASVLGLI